MNNPIKVLDAGAACMLGMKEGHLPPGCEGEIKEIDVDGDGKPDVIAVTAYVDLDKLKE